MTKVVYEIVEHDGGWAYRVGDVYSQTHASAEEAREAAELAAREQRQPDRSQRWIEYQDADGRWHREVEAGTDRPETDVES